MSLLLSVDCYCYLCLYYTSLEINLFNMIQLIFLARLYKILKSFPRVKNINMIFKFSDLTICHLATSYRQLCASIFLFVCCRCTRGGDLLQRWKKFKNVRTRTFLRCKMSSKFCLGKSSKSTIISHLT
jgi:hypothetical protein